MKIHFRIIVLIFVSAVLLSACQARAYEPTRQEQLTDTGLFGRHLLKGVAPKNGITGEFSGGFFILAGLANGSITPTTEFALSWYPVPGEFIYSYIPGILIRVVETPGLENPEIEYVFKQYWLAGTPSLFSENDLTYGDPVGGWSNQVVYYYTEGSKLNLNNFINPENLEIVRIYIDPVDLVENNLSK